jgi:ABC-type antimicrobial peptide transport system permease subunit
MTSFDLISMGIKNLLRRKTRTILTVLGVVIGTASIVVMLSLGLAMNYNFETELEGMGSLNIIQVNSNRYAWYGDEEEANKNKKIAKLDDKAVRDISALENVTSVLPLKEEYYTVKAGRNQAGVSLKITDMSKIDMLDLKIEEGYFPDGRSKYELLFGSQIENFFYNPRSRDWKNRPEVDVMSETLYMARDFWNIKGRGVKITAAGKLKETNGEQDWSVYMDINDFEELEKKLKRSQKENNNNMNDRNNQGDKYSSFKVKVEDLSKVSEISKTIKEMGFQTNSLTDVLDSMKETSAGIRAMLGGIGAVSLFVAAIGITNTMVMSIYERTREIGVMKVLGAELGDIKKLFLFEAAIIGFIGGLTGIAFSFGISYVLNNTGVDIMGSGGNGGMGYYGSPEEVKKIVSLIPMWLASSSVLFATIVGVASGYYPAVRAMNLSALEAIRNE